LSSLQNVPSCKIEKLSKMTDCGQTKKGRHLDVAAY